MRALLLVNPKATTTSERGRDVLVRALRSEVDLEVAYTRRRGHAVGLARQAAQAGMDLVVTLGGDGTINEAVNGLMTAHAPTSAAAGAAASERGAGTAGGAGSAHSERGAGSAGGPAGRGPALAVVPGGSTNVFARALGLPNDWAEATGAMLEALREGRSRTVGLGRADDRYFTFCAGFGLDAAVIRRVERARLRGRTATPALYLRATMSQYLRDWQASLLSTRFPDRRPPIVLERPGEPPAGGLALVVVQNTTPWTYLGERPITLNPGASFDLGLDVLGLRVLRLPSTTRTVAQVLSPRRDPHGDQVLRLHDLSEFTVRATRPQPFQLDGDFLGERAKVRFTAVPAALRVIC